MNLTSFIQRLKSLSTKSLLLIASSTVVVTATIDGVKYYYPVTLSKKLERNKAYTVEITITGLGSTDPDKPIEKGGLTAAITVLDWVDGGSYEETL